jgi:hypothetical protein
MTRPVSQPKARMTHIIQIREPKPGSLGNMNRSQIQIRFKPSHQRRTSLS